jgi:hypothetical protein
LESSVAIVQEDTDDPVTRLDEIGAFIRYQQISFAIAIYILRFDRFCKEPTGKVSRNWLKCPVTVAQQHTSQPVAIRIVAQNRNDKVGSAIAVHIRYRD